MRCTLALVSVTLLAVPEPMSAADSKTTTQAFNQLKAWFKQADIDSDGYLDKSELAKGFRGSKAKPYDEEGSDAKKEDDAKEESSEKSQKDKDYSKYPDYNFLKLTDKDGDGKVSKAEFESWAKDYSHQIGNQAASQKKLAQAEQRLSKAANAAERKEIEKEVKLLKEEAALEKKLQTQFQNMLKASATKPKK